MTQLKIYKHSIAHIVKTTFNFQHLSTLWTMAVAGKHDHINIIINYNCYNNVRFYWAMQLAQWRGMSSLLGSIDRTLSRFAIHKNLYSPSLDMGKELLICPLFKNGLALIEHVGTNEEYLIYESDFLFILINEIKQAIWLTMCYFLSS